MVESMKRKWYAQTFKEEWCSDELFKGWLKQDKNDKNSSYCKCCRFTLKNANRSTLLKHNDTEKHKRNFEASKSQVDISTFLKKNETCESEQIAKSELIFASFFSEHNIPFANIYHMIKACKVAFPDSKIAQKISLQRTKLSYLIQDGIAYEEKRTVTEYCRKQKFSIIIDETTDISVTQILAIVVRYFDFKREVVVDNLLDSVEVEDGTAAGLYKAVKTLLNQRNIPLENIIGFGSDNCSSMMGKKNGFQRLLQNDIPSVFIMGCVCHSFALCASYAVKVLPSYLESFLKIITTYFSRSSKRQRDFSFIQEAVSSPLHKIPKLSYTRWLSRESVISAILEQYTALKLYFEKETKDNKIDVANDIYKALSDNFTKPMLLFLQYILQKVNNLNVEFQSEHFRLHVMMTTEYRNILSYYIREDVLQNVKLDGIDLNNEKNHKKLSDIYLGGKATAYLINSPFNEDVGRRFRCACLKFLVELCNQFRKRFSFSDDSVISKLNALDPNLDIKFSPPSIIPLAINFPSFVPEKVLNELDDEWRSYKINRDTFRINSDNIPCYWNQLGKIKDGLGNSKYELLSSFMVNLTVLPHSSATVERVFSLMNCVKTRQTNSLKAGTVRDRILAKQAIQRDNH